MSDELRPVQSFFVGDEDLTDAVAGASITTPVYGPADRYGPEAGPDVPMTSVSGYTGGPNCPCIDDPYGCDGACVGA